jgi:hypothetical protein
MHYQQLPNLNLQVRDKEEKMAERHFTLPEMILFASTRVALGTGIGLLISRGLSKDASKAAGLALTVVGGLTTVPFILGAIARRQCGGVSEMRPAA